MRGLHLLVLGAFLAGGASTSHAQEANAQGAKKLFDVPFTFPEGSSNFDAGALSLSPDNRLLAVGESDRALHLLQFPSGKEVRALPPMAGVPIKAQFSPDGKRIAVVVAVRNEKDRVRGNVLALFDVTSGAKLWETTEILYMTQMVFWPATNQLAVSGTPSASSLTGRVLLVFDLQTGASKRLRDYAPVALGSDGHTVLDMGSSPAPRNSGDGNEVLTSVLKWNLDTPLVDKKRVGVESKGGFPNSSAKSGAVSADGSRMIALGSYDNAKLFDGRTGDFLATITDVGEYVTLDFSRDGRRLLIPSAFSARVFDATTGDLLATLTPPRPPQEVQAQVITELSDDGKTVLVSVPTSLSSRTIYAYDFTPGAQGAQALRVIDKNLAEFSASGNALALSPDGKTLLAAGSVLAFLRSDSGARLRSPSGADVVGSVAWSKDGAHILTGGTSLNSAQLWNAKTFAIERVLGQHEWPINAVALSPDGSIAAAGGSGFTGATRAATRGLVSLFDTKSGQRLKTLTALTGRPTALTFSPDGKWLATGGDDGSLDIWNVTATLASPDPDGGKPVAHVAAQMAEIASVVGLKWSATSGLFVARRGGSYGAIIIGPAAGQVLNVMSWRSGALDTLKTFRFASDKSQVATAFALSPDARRFAVGESSGYNAAGTIFVRDAASGATLASLPVAGAVHSLVFSPDGKTLYLQFRNDKGIGALQKWTFP